MKQRMICAAIVAGLFLSPFAAHAAEGYLVTDTTLQSGPDPEYPPITDLAAGTPVSVQGCIEGWTWCDVIAGGDRGWVPGSFVEEDYNGQRVVVMDYGPRISIPVVTFSIGTYWDHYYHSRPFYAQRTEWEHRNIRPHAPPRAPEHREARGGSTPQQHAPAPQPQQHAPMPARETRTVEPARPANAPNAPRDARTANEQRPADTARAVNAAHPATPPRPTNEPRAANTPHDAAPPHPQAVEARNVPPHPAPNATNRPAAPQDTRRAEPQEKAGSPRAESHAPPPKQEPKAEPRKEPPKDDKKDGGGR
ncbi:MAG TPA: SH3 domain-containing protein [Rudaea sp.]